MTAGDEAMTTQTEHDTPRALAVAMARAAADARCEDVVVIDVRGLSQLTDYIVLASGTSDRQMRTAADDAAEAAEAFGDTVFGVSADTGAHWIVVDVVDVVLHLFDPEARLYYDLESLWGDGPRVPWAREGTGAAGASSAGADG